MSTDTAPKKKSWLRRMAESAPVAMFEDVRLYRDRVECGRDRVSLPAHATVESAGELHSRVTATRLLATGVFAFALKKKRDDRELYLTVEGDDGAFVVKVDPKKGLDARKFAAKVNSARPA